ncbi:hypothetical protein OG589_15645 [Sphaerisporangium sp. NBC_01403]|uniref:Mu transposase domain-containing protein n=1 Tax=Sphaerisporangium sp. NBC_01403 TaxID=2903599 RepID=UPI00324EADA0
MGRVVDALGNEGDEQAGDLVTGERDQRVLLAPLPVEPFEIGRLLTPRVTLHGQISVRTNRYSVPIHLAGHQVRVMLFASHLVVYHKGVEVARWAAARRKRGDADGTRALIEVLLHRRMEHRHVVAGMEATLKVGALTADAVALEARKIVSSRTSRTSRTLRTLRTLRTSRTSRTLRTSRPGGPGTRCGC